MIARTRRVLLVNAGVMVGHHLLVLAARLVEAWAGTRRVPCDRQAAAVTTIAL